MLLHKPNSQVHPPFHLISQIQSHSSTNLMETPNKLRKMIHQEEMIHHEEILEDIFSRLPTKSIGQIRCVSKPWKTILEQPHFIKTHLNRTKQPPIEVQSLILIGHYPNSIFIIQLEKPHQMVDEITISATSISLDDHRFDNESIIGSLASCDGLTVIEDDDKLLVLVNPTTKEFLELPESPFALDPHTSFSMYGVGYDSVSDDHKVVSISYYDSDYEFESEPDCSEMFVTVYSVKTGTWKRVRNSPYDHAIGKLTAGVLVNERIHWLTCRKSDCSSVIIAFDFGTEEFRELPPPIWAEGKRIVYYELLTLGGWLCMYSASDIWVMKEYGVQESWTKITIVDPLMSEFRPICMLGTEHMVLMKDEETINEKVVIYDMNQAKFMNVVVEGIPTAFSVGGTFMESLISPHSSVEALIEE